MPKHSAGYFCFWGFFLLPFLHSYGFGQVAFIPSDDLQKDLSGGNYQDLMKIHDDYAIDLKEDGNDRHLEGYYGVLSRWENLGELEKWTKAEPNNFVAWTAVGQACLRKGLQYRGNDTVNKVSGKNLDTFEDYLKRAQPYFEYAAKLGPDDPYPYVSLMQIGLDNEWAPEKMWGYFHQAIAIAPRFQDAIWDMGLSLSPLWGPGSAEDMRQFTQKYCLTAPRGNYLRLFLVRCDEDTWHAQGSHNSYWGNTPAWQECQQELEDYLSVHPEDLNTRSWYSFFAFFGRHFRVAKAQFDVLGDRWNANPYHWLKKDGYMKAKDFANHHANDPNQGEF